MSENQTEFPHYFRSVKGLSVIDYYRIAELFGITNPAIAHAFKKLLAAGQRGAKDQTQDIQEVIKTLSRYLEMRVEDAALTHQQATPRKVMLNALTPSGYGRDRDADTDKACD